MDRWKTIEEFPDYEVSNAGEVRRAVASRTRRAGTRISGSSNRDGYPEVCLRRDGRAKNRRVHRLVWIAFNGPIPSGLQINHINGAKSDNRIENLELVTPRENTLHAIEVLGHTRKGEGNPSSTLTAQDVLSIRERASEGETRTDLAAEFGVSKTCISGICTGKTWKHLGGPRSKGRRGRPKKTD